MLYTLRTVLILSCLLLANKSFAFGVMGHELVCQLAYNHLTDATKQKVDALLTNIPPAQRNRINQYLHEPVGAPITFAKTCIWADAIKKDKRYDVYKPWHYMNIDRSLMHVDANTCTKNCIVQAIIIHSKQLKSAKNPWKKTQALMFLGHWLGDIHQPLHVSYEDDMGGNTVTIPSPDGRCTNLHWLWDECLITRSGLSQPQMLQTLEQQWQHDPIKQWQHSKIWQWADESLQIARSPRVGYCKLNHERCESYSPAVLGADYQLYFMPIVEQRLVQGGARLAALLDYLLH